MEIPKIFWAFYDQFRRKEITLTQFSQKTNLEKREIKGILREILKNT